MNVEAGQMEKSTNMLKTNEEKKLEFDKGLLDLIHSDNFNIKSLREYLSQFGDITSKEVEMKFEELKKELLKEMQQSSGRWGPRLTSMAIKYYIHHVTATALSFYIAMIFIDDSNLMGLIAFAAVVITIFVGRKISRILKKWPHGHLTAGVILAIISTLLELDSPSIDYAFRTALLIMVVAGVYRTGRHYSLVPKINKTLMAVIYPMTFFVICLCIILSYAAMIKTMEEMDPGRTNMIRAVCIGSMISTLIIAGLIGKPGFDWIIDDPTILEESLTANQEQPIAVPLSVQ